MYQVTAACTSSALFFVRTLQLLVSAFSEQNQSLVSHPDLFITPAIVKSPDDCGFLEDKFCYLSFNQFSIQQFWTFSTIFFHATIKQPVELCFSLDTWKGRHSFRKYVAYGVEILRGSTLINIYHMLMCVQLCWNSINSTNTGLKHSTW
jgi:hypothetical protein